MLARLQCFPISFALLSSKKVKRNVIEIKYHFRGLSPFTHQTPPPPPPQKKKSIHYCSSRMMLRR